MKYLALRICIVALFATTGIASLYAQLKGDVTTAMMCYYSPFSNTGKAVSETFGYGKNFNGYAYVEMSGLFGTPVSAYGQFYWEHKWWDSSIFLHAEYRGVLSSDFYESNLYAGAAFSIPMKSGYLAIEPLLMWKQGYGFGGQLSFVGGWQWNKFLLEHCTDFSKVQNKTSNVDIFSETRLYYNLIPHISIGLVGAVSCSDTDVTYKDLYLSLKFSL